MWWFSPDLDLLDAEVAEEECLEYPEYLEEMDDLTSKTCLVDGQQ